MWNTSYSVLYFDNGNKKIITSIIVMMMINILKLNVGYFYSLMFTRTNLRLVHIVCHDKQESKPAVHDSSLYQDDMDLGVYILCISRRRKLVHNPEIRVFMAVYSVIITFFPFLLLRPHLIIIFCRWQDLNPHLFFSNYQNPKLFLRQAKPDEDQHLLSRLGSGS